MGIVISMFLIAAGAVMRFAVTVKGHGFNVHTTGVILIIVGAIGVVLSIAYWASWGGFGSGSARRRTTVVSTQPTTPVVQRSVAQEAPIAQRSVIEEHEVR